MDSIEYAKIYKEHVNIAKRMFLKLPNKQEGMEWAEFAVHVAILTHDKERSDLSTHVFNTARKYKNKFIRSYKRWSGIGRNHQRRTAVGGYKIYVSTALRTRLCINHI